VTYLIILKETRNTTRRLVGRYLVATSIVAIRLWLYPHCGKHTTVWV